MTDTTTIGDEPDATDDDGTEDLTIGALLDYIADDPPAVLVMAGSVVALHTILQGVLQASNEAPHDPTIQAVIAIALEFGALAPQREALSEDDLVPIAICESLSTVHANLLEVTGVTDQPTETDPETVQ